MAFDFNTLVTDRKQSDVAYVKQLIAKIVAGTETEAELAEWKSFTLKGAYNHTDLNRVTAAMDALKAKLEGYGYAVPGYQRIKVPHPVTGGGSRLPEGYTELAWIESTGTQYIDSGVTVSSVTIKGLRVVADFNFVTVSGTNFLGISDSNAVFWFGTFGGNIWYGDGVNSLQTGVAYDGKRRVFDLDAKNGTFTVRGTSVSVSGISINNPSGSGKFLLPAGGSGFVLYSCQMYDNDVLVRDFVPCKNSGGVVGLYDLANDVFYQNAGSGTFAAGEEVVASATASDIVVYSSTDEYDPYLWYEFDWPTPQSMTVYLQNVSIIRSVLAVLASTPQVPDDMVGLMVQEANDIEVILLDVYKQINIMTTTFIPCGEALCGGDNL